MALPDPENAPESAWLGGALTWIAGFVDAMGYLTLSHIYAANMSGNSVALAIKSAQRNWREVFAHGCPLLAFVPGLIAGAMMVEVCKRARLRAALMPALLVEAVWLGVFAVAVQHFSARDGSIASTDGWRFFLTVGVVASAMGIQNGALRQVGTLKEIHTYVTGTLLATANGLTKYLFWLIRRVRTHSRHGLGHILRYSLRHRSLREALFAFALWAMYVIGAIFGAVLLLHLGIAVIAVPMAMLLIIASIDLIRPVWRRAPAFDLALMHHHLPAS